MYDWVQKFYEYASKFWSLSCDISDSRNQQIYYLGYSQTLLRKIGKTFQTIIILIIYFQYKVLWIWYLLNVWPCKVIWLIPEASNILLTKIKVKKYSNSNSEFIISVESFMYLPPIRCFPCNVIWMSSEARVFTKLLT